MIDWKEFYYYDEGSPSCLKRNTDWACGPGHKTIKGFKGDCLLDLNDAGYYRTFHKTKAYLIHRIIWELFNGEIPEDMVIDHIDGDTQNNKISNLRLVSRAINQRNCKKGKNSGEVTGVCRYSVQRENHVDYYWRAIWAPLGAKSSKSKHFSINRLGDEEAFRKACEYRQKMIDQLNAMGAGYSDRHGN